MAITTFAYFSNGFDFLTGFDADPFNTTVTESFVSPDNWKPGDTTDKQVFVTNNNDSDVDVVKAAKYGDTVTIKLNTQEYSSIESFKLNGETIDGDSFIMPDEDVEITDIEKIPAAITIEYPHNPYNNSENKIYYENTFAGATSITVELTYQTESTTYDWVYLYSSSSTVYQNKKYGGTTKKTETITIPSNYIKIVFRTDVSDNNYYGFKAIITPNYD